MCCFWLAQTNISEDHDHNIYLSQINLSEALEQMTNYSERYKWRSMSSWIVMQLCEDSLTFKNFRSWYFIQTAIKASKS